MAPATNDERSAKLSSGYSMPLLGLGCWQLKSADPVEAALDAGYRHLDTAYLYTNEKLVGEGIRRWIAKGGGKREDVFVTTKLPMIGMTPAGVDKFLRKSLENLGLDYVDLYLVHSPLGMLGAHDDDLLPRDDKKQIKLDFSTDLIAVWKAMEGAAAAGLARSIGVSNYSIKQLRKTLAIAKTPPAVQQIELHVRYQQPNMVQFCKKNNILLTAYGALGSPGRGDLTLTSANMISLLDDPVVMLVAANHEATPAQVLTKFWLQQGVSVIPKSANPTRIAENAKVYGWQLSPVELAALKTLDLGADGRTFLIPKDSTIREHPEYSD